MSEPTPRLRVVRPGDETAPAADGPPRLRTAWTADELMAETFPRRGGRCPDWWPKASI